MFTSLKPQQSMQLKLLSLVDTTENPYRYKALVESDGIERCMTFGSLLKKEIELIPIGSYFEIKRQPGKIEIIKKRTPLTYQVFKI